MHQAQAPHFSSLGEVGLTPTTIARTKIPRAVGSDALRFISTSISDDLSQKDKVQARQLSALMPPTPPRTQAAVQDRAQQDKPPLAPVELPRRGSPPRGSPPRRVEDSDVFYQLGEEGEPVYLSKTPMDSSHAQRKPRKRPRLELTSKAVALREDLQNLDAHELEDLIEQLGQRTKQKPFKYLILYRIAPSRDQPSHPRLKFIAAARNDSTPLYFDPPQWTKGQSGPGVLRSQLPVTNFDLYLEKNKDISFIVYKTYGIPQDISKMREMRDQQSAAHDLNDAVVDESIQPVNEALVNAVDALLEAEDEYVSILKSFRQTSELAAPYLFVFHQRNDWEKVRLSLPESSHRQLAMLWDYILQSQGAEYAVADSKISLGKITPELLKYLFKPGQLLVQNKDDEMQGWICEDWPRVIQSGETVPLRQAKTAGVTKHEKSESHARSNPQLELSAWHWEFDGEFQRKKETLSISIEVGTHKESGIPIKSLDVFPLEYASDATFNQLRRRGRSFWECRKRALVSYRGDSNTNEGSLVGAFC